MKELPIHINRRTFLRRSATGIGGLALASLLDPMLLAGAARADNSPGIGGKGADRWRGVMNPPQYPPKIRRVIYLYMAGGPSHLETFDYKPELAKLTGQPMPESFTKGQQIAQLQGQKLKCY